MQLSPDKRRARRTAATLMDVAQLAGVSTSTAGRVLRGSHLPVAALVAERVRAAAEKLKYVPNVLARNLRGARPTMVGLIVGDMLDPYYGEIAEVVTKSAEAKHGMLAIVCNMQRDPQLELKYCRQLWEHRVAGLILTGGGFDHHALSGELSTLTRSMQSAGVILTTLGPRFIDAPMFSVDYEAVGRVAAEYMLDRGHRQFAVITGRSRSETARLRLAGTTVALKKRRAKFSVLDADFTRESVAEAVDALMKASPGVTAVLAGSDFIARVAIDCLTARRIKVPRDISVIGVGNTPLAELSPRLTTVDTQLAACSNAALDHIAAGGTGAKAIDAALFPVSVVDGSTVSTPH